MLHLLKLAVGAKDPAQVAAFQAARARTDPPLRHRTRMIPKRAAELSAGGSIYWVIAGFIQLRQEIVEVREEDWDGRNCAGLLLDPKLVPVQARPQKAFQGWRYLAPDAAPPDARAVSAAEGLGALPAKLREELRELGLL